MLRAACLGSGRWRALSRRDQKAAIPIPAGAEVGGPTQSQSIREDALKQREQGFMGHSTEIFEQPPSSVINVQTLDALCPSGELPVTTAADFAGFEPFVDELVIARFLQVTPRRVLEMARDSEIPAHPIGKRTRNTWRFRISEIDAHFSPDRKNASVNLRSAVPGATRRKQ